MLVIAHRGAWFNGRKEKDVIYQNTWQAFDDADALGLRAVEADIRRCECGELLLSHDPFTGCACKRLARLDDILPYGEQMTLHLEIKEKGLVKDILKSTLPLRHENVMVYSSFKWFELWKVRLLHKRARIGLLWGGEDKKIPKFLVFLAASWLGAESIHLDFELIKKNSSLVPYFSAKSFAIYSYTVNEEDDIKLAKKLDLDGIFTDFPEQAIKFLSMPIPIH